MAQKPTRRVMRGEDEERDHKLGKEDYAAGEGLEPVWKLIEIPCGQGRQGLGEIVES